MMGQHANNQSSQAPVLGMAASLRWQRRLQRSQQPHCPLLLQPLPVAPAHPYSCSCVQPLPQTRTRTMPPTTAASAQAADATATGARLPTYYYTCYSRAD